MQLIQKDNPDLSLTNQLDLLEINRSTFYKPKLESSDEVDLMNEIQEIHLQLPQYGYRKITKALCQNGRKINHKKVQRLMQKMGLKALFPSRRPGATKVKPHAIYPYLLSGLSIESPNHVWGTDITYIRLNDGFVYLVALIDCFSRYIVEWNLDICMEQEFCITMLESAFKKARPKILNTDQGSQFTSKSWINKVCENGIQLSMVGKGRCLDNILIERFWRTLKYEDVYLRSYTSVADARSRIGAFVDFYNRERFHQSLGYRTPEAVYLDPGFSQKTLPN